jgi:hypothetical protein
MPGIPPDRVCDSQHAIQSHEFIQQFLANERQLDLDAEAKRAHLAAFARGVRRPSRRLLPAGVAALVRRGDVRGTDGRSTALRRGVGKSWPSTPLSARSSALQFGTDTGRAPTSSESPAAEQIIEAITS